VAALFLRPIQVLSGQEIGHCLAQVRELEGFIEDGTERPGSECEKTGL
jgi:hypothetical protein